MTRSVAKTSTSAVISRGSLPSTQLGASPSSTTRQVVCTNTATSSSLALESTLVMLSALTGLSTSSPVDASSLAAWPLRCVVVSTSSGVFSATPGAQTTAMKAASSKAPLSPSMMMETFFRTAVPLPRNQRSAKSSARHIGNVRATRVRRWIHDAEDDDQVPGDQLAQHGDPQQPPGPAGVVARAELDHVGQLLPAGPPQTVGDGHREERLAVAVLRLAAVLAQVATPGPASAQEVPRRGLVAAPGPEPHGVAEVDQPTRPGHPRHLLGHPPRVRHVLEHVGGVADVDGAVGERQLHAAADHGARGDVAQAGELTDVGVEGEVRRPGRLERVAEVARSAADVEQRRALRVDVLAQLGDRVGGQRRVEARRVGLLVPEVPEQADGPPQSCSLCGSAQLVEPYSMTGCSTLTGDLLGGLVSAFT